MDVDDCSVRVRVLRPAACRLARLGLLTCLVTAVGRLQASAPPPPPDVERVEMPRIFPDYQGLVIPPNIAPLNFRIEGPGDAWRVRIAGVEGAPVELESRSSAIEIPMRPWQRLLEANRGRSLRVDIAHRLRGGPWRAYATVTNTVALEPIDSHLVYRLLRPAYSLYGELGIYQRNLEAFQETPVLENRDFDHGCVNCHTFNQNRPETMALHIRLKGTGNPMLLVRSNEVVQVAKTAGYLAWHPNGELLAYSSNRFRLFYHTTGETRDVFDLDSDLGIYRLADNTLVVPPVLAQPNRLENWPAWSPDGRYLYYSSAPKLRFERYDRIRYDLLRAAYDPDQDTWGEAEVLVAAADLQKSVNEPRVSPDGRWVLCCVLPYGNFPPYQAASDLYVLDLTTRRFRPVEEINSDQCDSYPCWSSNGRWLVFNSKRIDGLFSRPHFSYVDEQGRFSKPWVLPQQDPCFYDACIKNYNRPELVTGPVPVGPRDLVRGLFQPNTLLKPGNAPEDEGMDQPFEQPGRHMGTAEPMGPR